MESVDVTTELDARPVAMAMALTVAVVYGTKGMVKGAVYFVEAAVGVVPSRV